MGIETVLVVGGTGFVGRYVINRLVSQGRKVLVPTRSREHARHLFLLPTVDVIETDVGDAAALGRLATAADAVINLSGILNESGAQTFERVHVELARKVVAACHAGGVRRLVHMSALNADPRGPSRYLRSKGEAETVVAGSGLDWTIFQPSVIFGREDRFLNLFARLQALLPVVAIARADARFAPVFVGDVARCFVHALYEDDTVGERYTLCGPEVYTLGDLVRYVGAVTGHRRPVLPLGAGLGRLQAALLERLPGKLMSRDNLASMDKDSVCGCAFPPVFDFAPTAVEAVVPNYLSPASAHSRFDAYRSHSGR